MLKKIDTFTKNILIVFLGTSVVNAFNLAYQILIAHRLSPADFAAFNALLSLFIVVSTPLLTLQAGVAKWVSEFNANNQVGKLKFFLSGLFKKTVILGACTFFIFLLASIQILNALKIPSVSSGYILAGLLALSWPSPLFSGAVQGLELFGWLSFASVVSGALKLAAAFILVSQGFGIAGALGALLISSVVFLLIFYFPLKGFIFIRPQKEEIGYKALLTYLLPVALSYFCFMNLVSFDMILVKYFFAKDDSGIYSLAQMVGKIFLFLPGAISIVMFPKTSGLRAKNLDTAATLRKSLLYAAGLCVFAGLAYNIFPAFTLKALTGKAFPQALVLGRLFSVSMTFFTLLFILITYFLSIKDLRFIKYLVIFTLLQFLAVVLFHKTLMQVQLILCVNSILLFFIHFLLSCEKH